LIRTRIRRTSRSRSSTRRIEAIEPRRGAYVPETAIREGLDPAGRRLVPFGRLRFELERRAECGEQRIGRVADHIEPAAFLRTVGAERRDDHATAGLHAVAHLTHVGRAILGAR